MKHTRLFTCVLIISLLFTCTPVICIEVNAKTAGGNTSTAINVQKPVVKVSKPKKKATSNTKSNIKLTRTKLSINVGVVKSIRLKNASASGLKWSSSNKKIATVSKDGQWGDIYAKKAGSCTITATYKGKKYSCKVTVAKKKSKAVTASRSTSDDIELTLVNYTSLPYVKLRFTSSVRSLEYNYSIGNSKYVSCRWDSSYGTNGWKTSFNADNGTYKYTRQLIVQPKLQFRGSTVIKIKNNYNSQVLKYNVNVEWPLTNADYKISGGMTKNYGTDLLNYLNKYYSNGWGILFCYFNPDISSSKQGCITTARGIHIGDTKSKVISRYGKGTEGAFNKDDDYRYDTVKACNVAAKPGKTVDLSKQMESECVSFIRYKIDYKHRISCYFDENDYLTWIFYELSQPN